MSQKDHIQRKHSKPYCKGFFLARRKVNILIAVHPLNPHATGRLTKLHRNLLFIFEDRLESLLLHLLVERAGAIYRVTGREVHDVYFYFQGIK
jgi:hypothetical protein